MIPRGKAWALALTATLTMTISYLDRQTLAVLAPTVTEAFHLSETDYGWLASAFSFAYLVGAPLAGQLIDRVGARRGLLASLLVWTAISAAHAIAPTYAALFALRILLGLAEAPSFPGAAQVVHRVLPPDERARGLGVLFTGSSIGAMIAPKLATSLALVGGFRGAFLGSALVGLAWVPLWLWLTHGDELGVLLGPARGQPADASPADKAGSWAIWRHPAVWRGVLAVLSSAPGLAFSLLWASKYLVKVLKVPPLGVGGYLWLPPLLYDLGSVFFGDLSTRRSRRRQDGSAPGLLIAIAALLTSFLALASQLTDTWLTVICLGFAMAGGGGIYALATSDMMARVPSGAISSAGGITAAAQSLTYIILNPLIGRHLDHGGTYASVMIILGFWALPGVAIWVIHRPPPLTR